MCGTKVLDRLHAEFEAPKNDCILLDILLRFAQTHLCRGAPWRLFSCRVNVVKPSREMPRAVPSTRNLLNVGIFSPNGSATFHPGAMRPSKVYFL